MAATALPIGLGATSTMVAAIEAPTRGDSELLPLCRACCETPPPLSEVHSAFLYGFPLDRLLPRFKFHRDLAAGRLLAQGMAAGLCQHTRPNALVPIPLHRSRLRERGFDQALELARPLGRMLGVPVRTDLLLRAHNTSPQSRLNAEARASNLRGAFCVLRHATPQRHIALVDDVMTTGATLHAAAEALFNAGAERVDAWICARVP